MKVNNVRDCWHRQLSFLYIPRYPVRMTPLIAFIMNSITYTRYTFN